MKYKRLSECAEYRQERTRQIDFETYISTENMLPNKSGISVAESLPDTKTTSKYLPNDILLSNIRPYFKKIWLSNREGGCSNDVLVVTAKSDYLPEYLYYVLSDNNFFNYDTVTSKGTKMPRGTPKAIMKYLVPDVDIEYQKRIISILSKYDNLIEANNKRIKILERMAEELYKEWFVRFRFPGYETTEFENGIPKGWDIVRMNNFCYVTDGTHDTPAPTIDGVPLVTGKSLKEGFVDFSETYNISIKDHKQIKKRSGLKDGDILFSNIGTVGSTCVVDYDREFSVKNVIIFKLDAIEKTVYLYLWLNSKPMQDIFSMQTNGSSQQFVGLTFMRKYKVMVPQQNVLEKFCSLVNPIFEERKILHRENEYLMKQRDLLLPRLMSGKLEV